MAKNDKTTLDGTFLLIAFEFGRVAHRQGKSAIPALDTNIMNMIPSGGEIGASIPILTAWINGWHTENAHPQIET